MCKSLSCGRVIKTTGSWYLVQDSSNVIQKCRLKGQMRIKGFRATNPVVVGDNVMFFTEDNQQTGIIQEIEERKNYIIRRATKLSRESHIIAANIDRAFLIVTLLFPRTSTGFIDRFLVTASAYNIPVTIVVNKSDLYSEKHQEILSEMENVYNDAGYSFLCVSALNGNNVAILKEQMKDKFCLFAGHSGSGKSALINAIQPGLNLKVGNISDVHLKGKHTTTFTEMFPLDFGGYIIDTPGIKELGLIDIKKDELFHFFPEMFRLLNKCRFYNCTHTGEPDCAVRDAVNNGFIAGWRYENYINMLAGNDMDVKNWE